MSEEALVVQLAKRQLEAYNEGDLDAFCACYAPDVVVLDGDGQVSMEGMEVFRQRYGELFARFRTSGQIRERLCLPPHVVEHELYQREDRQTGERSAGEVLVRYTEEQGLIAKVQFFRP